MSTSVHCICVPGTRFCFLFPDDRVQFSEGRNRTRSTTLSQRVECPHCHESYAYSPAIRGRAYHCTHCRVSFTVSSGSQAPPPLPGAIARPASISRSRPSLAPDPERTSGAVARFGLIAIFLFGVSIIATGIGYLLWPSSPTAQVPQTSNLEAPRELPSDVERPKSLNEILNDRPPGGVGKQKGG